MQTLNLSSLQGYSKDIKKHSMNGIFFYSRKVQVSKLC